MPLNSKMALNHICCSSYCLVESCRMNLPNGTSRSFERGNLRRDDTDLNRTHVKMLSRRVRRSVHLAHLSKSQALNHICCSSYCLVESCRMNLPNGTSRSFERGNLRRDDTDLNRTHVKMLSRRFRRSVHLAHLSKYQAPE